MKVDHSEPCKWGANDHNIAFLKALLFGFFGPIVFSLVVHAKDFEKAVWIPSTFFFS